MDSALGSWSALGQGMVMQFSYQGVYALALQDDTLYAGGDFLSASGVSGTRSIAAWSKVDGSWHSLGTGISRTVKALAVQDDTVYVGGAFADDTSASGVPGTKRIAAWSTADNTWHSLGTGISDTVNAIAVKDDTVYVGGVFASDTSASGVPGTKRIAAWSNVDDTWHPLGTGTSGDVNALAVLDDSIYLGGNFWSGSLAGGVPGTVNIAAWSNADDTYRPLGTGTDNSVYALATTPDNLYAGGGFSSASGVSAKMIAQWSNVDDSWHPLGTGLASYVRALATDDTRGLVYAAGLFTTTDGGVANALRAVGVWDEGIREWIPFQWSDDSNGILPDGSLPSVSALAADDSVVFVAGQFRNAGDNPDADYIAKWTWSSPEGANAVSSLPATLSGKGFIGVPPTGAVTFGGVPVTYTRDDSTHITVTAAPGAPSGPIRVNGVGGWANVGTFSASTPPAPVPDPVYPPSAPLSVTGTAGDASATISWAAPTSTGSFPVTNYEAVVSPGGKSCLVSSPALACDITGLANGTTYTSTVRALNGAGWGEYSSTSAPFTPHESMAVTIMIRGSRGDVRGKLGIIVEGRTTGFEAGAVLRPWLRYPGQIGYTEGSAQILVDATGGFTWTRQTAKTIYLIIRSADGTVHSNRLVIRSS